MINDKAVDVMMTEAILVAWIFFEYIFASKKFNIAENLIPDGGRDLKCSSCGNIWHYEVDTNFETTTSKLLNESNKETEITKTKIENEEIKTDISKINIKEIGTNVIKDKKENEKANQGIKNILAYFLIIIISLLAIILLADTFKLQIINSFPNLIPLFDSFYETLLDLKLFLIDLTN